MHGPENLFYAIEIDAVTRLFARIICRKAAVIRWMPIFGGQNQIEMPLQFIYNRNDFITLRDGQSASRQKIVLQIYDDKRVHQSRPICSFAQPINFDRRSWSDRSNLILYDLDSLSRKISGGVQLSCLRVFSRDASIVGAR